MSLRTSANFLYCYQILVTVTENKKLRLHAIKVNLPKLKLFIRIFIRQQKICRCK